MQQLRSAIHNAIARFLKNQPPARIIAVGFALLTAVFLLPVDEMEEHVLASIPALSGEWGTGEESYEQVLKGYASTQLDNGTPVSMSELQPGDLVFFNNGNSSNNNPSSDDPTNSTIQTAEKYIGMSIDDLVGAVGDSQSSEYDDDSATGTTGYYYYPDFTVSTSVDEEGNEIVTGVW